MKISYLFGGGMAALPLLSLTPGFVRAQEAPPLSTSVGENLPAGTVVTTLEATDPDPGETFTFHLVSGAGADNNGSFTISGNELRTAAALDAETAALLRCRIRVTDSGLNSYEQPVNVTVVDDVNEDADADGLTEAQEDALGLSDSQPDTDGDVASDGVEVAAGTDPKVSGSTPAFSQVAVHSNSTTAVSRAPGGIGDAVQISAGRDHGLLLRRNGAVVAWGDNAQGQTTVPVLGLPALAVAAGGDASGALLSDGSLVTWGAGALGTVLPGPFIDARPFQSGWIALRADGTVQTATAPGATAIDPAPFAAVTDVRELRPGRSVSGAAGMKETGAMARWGDLPAGISVRAAMDGLDSFGAGGSTWAALTLSRQLYAGNPSNSPTGGELVPNYFPPLTEIAAIWSGHVAGISADGLLVESLSPMFFGGLYSAGPTQVTALSAAYSSFVYLQASAAPPVPQDWMVSSPVEVNWTPPVNGAVTTWNALGLPPGLTINPATGAITGTAAPGRYFLRLFAGNGVSRADGRASLYIPQPGTSAPSNLAIAPATAAENAPANSLTFTLTVTDADAGDTHVISKLNGPGGEQNALFTLAGNVLTLNAPVDQETTPLLHVRLAVTDSQGNRLYRNVTITVLDDLSEDADRDGLTETQEHAHGTSDTDADSDDDSFTDGFEVAKGTNPLDPSSTPQGARVFSNLAQTAGSINLVPELDDPVQVAAGNSFLSFALERGGRVKGWGQSASILGDVNDPPPPGDPPGVWITADQVWGGVLRRDGSVRTWGVCPRPPSTGAATAVEFAANPSVLIFLGTDGKLHWDGHPTPSHVGAATQAQADAIEQQWSALTDVVGIKVTNGWGVALKADGTHYSWGTVPATFPASGLGSLSSLQVVQRGWSAAWPDGHTEAWAGTNPVPSMGLEAAQISAAIPFSPTGLPFNARTAERTLSGELLFAQPFFSMWTTQPVTGITDIAAASPASTSGVLLAVHSGGSSFLLTGAPRVTVTEGPVDVTLCSVQWPGNPQPLTWNAIGVPPGLTLDPVTGRLTGVASAGKTCIRVWADSPFARVHRVVQLSVTDGGNAAPVSVTAVPLTLNEALVPGTGAAVSQLAVVDPDEGDTHTLALVSGEGDAQNSFFQLSGKSLQLIQALDHETQPSISIRVRAVDAGGEAVENAIVFTVANAVSDDSDGDGLSEAEEAALGTSNVNADTDGDGATDGTEVARGTNPLDAQSVPETTRLFAASTTATLPLPPPAQETVAIAATSSSVLLLQRDGTVAALPAFSTGHPALTWTNIADINGSSFAGFTAIQRDGTLLVAGGVQPPPDMGPVVDASLSAAGGIALLRDGSVRQWGSTAHPLMVAASNAAAGLTGIVHVSLGSSVGGLLTSDGTIRPIQGGAGALGSMSFGGTLMDAFGNVLVHGSSSELFLHTSFMTGYPLTVPPDGLVQAAAGAQAVLTRSTGGTASVQPAGFTLLPEAFAALDGKTRAMDIAAGNTVAALLSATAVPGPAFNVPAVLPMRLGEPIHLVIGAARAQTEYFALGLPDGLSLDAVTGVLSGTPQSVGRHVIRFFVRAPSGQREERRFAAVTTGNPPTGIALGNTFIAENLPAGSEVGRFQAQVAAAAGRSPRGAVTYNFALVNGPGAADNAKFTISGNRLLTAVPLDAEAQSTYSVRVRVTDSNANSYDQTFTITATDVPEAPSFAAWLAARQLAAGGIHASGLPAIQVYAHGLESPPAGVPAVGIVVTAEPGGRFVEIRFRRLIGAAAAAAGAGYDWSYGGVTYRIEKSSALNGWQGAREDFDVVETTPVSADTEIVSLRSRNPASEARAFFRVNVQQSP